MGICESNKISDKIYHNKNDKNDDENDIIKNLGNEP